MLGIHLGAFDGLDHDHGRLFGAMGPPSCRYEPVVVVCREQNELPAPVSSNLYRLAQGCVLELAELALELYRRGLRHRWLRWELDN